MRSSMCSDDLVALLLAPGEQAIGTWEGHVVAVHDVTDVNCVAFACGDEQSAACSTLETPPWRQYTVVVAVYDEEQCCDATNSCEGASACGNEGWPLPAEPARVIQTAFNYGVDTMVRVEIRD
ncbi:MAG: hypothetical protein JKY37_11120 [Nannocystaceae bacterium]|nr:hypothetical protein [Nannocystaceae bacterium]